jgi:hypothetical protein
MGVACGTHGRNEKYKLFGKLEEKLLGELGIDGRIILKWVLLK